MSDNSSPHITTTLNKEMCRTCLGTEDVSPFTNIDIDGLSVTAIFKYSLSMEVNLNDLLPQNICKVCLNKLDSSYKFKKQCLQIDATLKFLAERKEETPEEDFVKLIIVNEDEEEEKETQQEPEEEAEDEERSRLIQEKIDEDLKNLKKAVTKKKYRYKPKEGGPYKCCYCKLIVPTKSILSQHYKSVDHTAFFKHKCKHCGRSFGRKYQLSSHLIIHTKERPCKCQYCPKTFRTRASRNRHEMRHTGERPYLCDKCGKTFVALSEMKAHSYVHQENGPNPLKTVCTYCGKAMLPSNYKIHVRMHTGEKPFSCKICSKAFSQRRCLKLHLLVMHSDAKKPFDCKLCSKCFRTKQCLKVHMRGHTGERPYKCKLCPQTFRWSIQLQSHVMVDHFKELPYSCGLCDKQFPVEYNLKIHMKSHEKEVNKCEECGKVLRSAYHLNKHLNRHRRERRETE